ncbi:MAG: DUF58 domain-containing protein [Hyphomicrobiales bacterium]|nr:DUF58 domain-containing protein [Hyphomicrobiales bacterium]
MGALAPRESGQETLARARARAALIPDLLVDASRVANNVFSGWHGRRKRGIGENFWQFRHYVNGEALSTIDWRRSARDDQLYIRDREWQAAHTIWLWVDESPSMLFQSDSAHVSKQSRALVLAFAMSELLARSGERIGWLGLTKPIVARNAAEKLASFLLRSAPQTRIPDFTSLNSFADIILFGDFLDPVEYTLDQITRMARQGVRGHLVQIIDPAEENFPYGGRVEFNDPESGMRITTGSAGDISREYKNLFAARIQTLREKTIKLGWTHTIHRTDSLASRALIALHTNLSGDANYSSAAMKGAV